MSSKSLALRELWKLILHCVNDGKSSLIIYVFVRGVFACVFDLLNDYDDGDRIPCRRLSLDKFVFSVFSSMIFHFIHHQLPWHLHAVCACTASYKTVSSSSLSFICTVPIVCYQKCAFHLCFIENQHNKIVVLLLLYALHMCVLLCPVCNQFSSVAVSVCVTQRGNNKYVLFTVRYSRP